MAHIPSILLFLLFSLPPYLSTARVIINDDYSIFEVYTICKQTTDFDFCSQALNSDPRTPTADLVTFSEISLDLASRNATDTSKYISQLLSKATDPVIKEHLSVCSQAYKSAIEEIGEAYKLLQSKSYEALSKEAVAVRAKPVVCENSFKGTQSPLTSKNENLERLAVIVGVIADLLG
ncbi:pectinesterase inhibitor-like [Magnolia sinica]|uniref:pectinesterase inhibitor-like n=1 Tax=Magnolia sinica TaxID=86752 RepID=UPI00265A09D0|nr:pectinesterase inhibitor-like [Magnolia sinica]